MFPPDPELAEVLKKYKKIHVVGLSPNKFKTSYGVSEYMQSQGYKIIPVRPDGSEVLGEKSYPSLGESPGPVEFVNVFRRPEFVSDLVTEAIQAQAKVLWLQLGITDPEAEKRAVDAGIFVVSDVCILVQHKRLQRLRLL